MKTNQLFDLTGRVALITGAASGLGAAMASGLAGIGATVHLADVDPAVMEGDLGFVAERHHLDVTDARAVQDVIDDVAMREGHLDVLVNSAGIAERHAAEEFPEDAWDRIIAVNLKGSFLTCQAAGRHMLAAGRGSIINIASIGASIGYPLTTAYLQSKGGVAQLTRSLAVEWADRGIRVNAIAPGLFDTPIVARANRSTDATSRHILERTPMGRVGRPEELIGPAVFLASDASSMVTGHILQVDGGYLAA